MSQNKSKIGLEIAKIFKYEKEEIRAIMSIEDGETKVVVDDRFTTFIRREGDIIRMAIVDKKKGTTNKIEISLGGNNNGRSV